MIHLKRIEKFFSSIISHEIVEDTSLLYIKLKTNTEWDIDMATEFQLLVLDRNPEAFGGPYKFTCEKKDENFIVEWNCYNIAGF